MQKVMIVYWSGTGNTETMAGFVADGVREAGAEAEVLAVNEITADALAEHAAFALGCPSMGAEQLEESEMEPFMNQLDSLISGRQIGLFGSYGWGNQEWLRDWEERVRADGATVVNGEGVAANGEPDEDAIEGLKKLGAALAAV